MTTSGGRVQGRRRGRRRRPLDTPSPLGRSRDLGRAVWQIVVKPHEPGAGRHLPYSLSERASSERSVTDERTAESFPDAAASALLSRALKRAAPRTGDTQSPEVSTNRVSGRSSQARIRSVSSALAA